jgi:hypothetical protein
VEVIIFCCVIGTRLREETEFSPKTMVTIEPKLNRVKWNEQTIPWKIWSEVAS